MSSFNWRNLGCPPFPPNQSEKSLFDHSDKERKSVDVIKPVATSLTDDTSNNRHLILLWKPQSPYLGQIGLQPDTLLEISYYHTIHAVLSPQKNVKFISQQAVPPQKHTHHTHAHACAHQDVKKPIIIRDLIFTNVFREAMWHPAN